MTGCYRGDLPAVVDRNDGRGGAGPRRPDPLTPLRGAAWLNVLEVCDQRPTHTDQQRIRIRHYPEVTVLYLDGERPLGARVRIFDGDGRDRGAGFCHRIKQVHVSAPA